MFPVQQLAQPFLKLVSQLYRWVVLKKLFQSLKLFGVQPISSFSQWVRQFSVPFYFFLGSFAIQAKREWDFAAGKRPEGRDGLRMQTRVKTP